MAITLDFTVGGASANSFVTLTEANTYASGRLNAQAWEDDATDDTKNRALVEATRWLTELSWTGRRTTDTQALSWPRDFAIDPDSPTGQFFANNAIPQCVKDATMELALQFLKGGTTDISTYDTKREIDKKKTDVLETTYSADRAKRQGLNLYPTVTRLISDITVGGNSLNMPTVRG